MNFNKITESIKGLLRLGDPFFEKDSWLHRENICDVYFKEIVDEIDEAKAEFRKDNVIKLEDELGDIFWDYIMLLQTLERKDYIRSVENVFGHCEKKFTERLGFIHLNKKVNSEKYWDMVKKKQKIQLKKVHEELYGK